MRVLVTGGGGFVGAHVIAELLQRGHEVVALVRSPERLEHAMTCVLGGAGTRNAHHVIETIVGDATDAHAVRRAMGVSHGYDDREGAGHHTADHHLSDHRLVDAVVHAAATVSMNKKEAKAVGDSNERATRTVLGLAASKHIGSIVHVSSVTVFEPTLTVPVSINAPLRQHAGPYGMSKIASENVARSLDADRSAVSIVYPSAVIGPNAPSLGPVHDSLMSFALFAPLMTSGINVVDVRDLAHQIVEALTNKVSLRWISSAQFITWRNLYDRIESVTGLSLRRVPMSGPLMRGAGKFMDVTRISLPLSFPLTYEAMVEATQAATYVGKLPLPLNSSYRDLDVSLVDTYQWLWDTGALEHAQPTR